MREQPKGRSHIRMRYSSSPKLRFIFIQIAAHFVERVNQFFSCILIVDTHEVHFVVGKIHHYSSLSALFERAVFFGSLIGA